MQFRFTIARKIGTGFGLFIAVVALVFFLTNNTLNESREINRLIKELYTPSLQGLEELKYRMERAGSLMKQWAFIQTRSDQPEKTEALDLCKLQIPASIDSLSGLVSNWDDSEQALFTEVRRDIDILLGAYTEIQTSLPSFESYEDPLARMDAEFRFEKGELIDVRTAALSSNLNKLIEHHQTKVKAVSDNMVSTFDKLRLYIGNISILVLFGGVFIAVITSRSIIIPIQRLKLVLYYLGKGIYPKEPIKPSSDEIGDMAFALNRLVSGLERTRDFTREVGKGNFSIGYEPLSEEDELGYTLLKMREDLAITERELEQKVKERTDEVVRQKEEIEIQKNKVTELYKDLTDSINYAKRLQNTILPSDEFVHTMFPDSFVVYRPKDIVSGDFYWFKTSGNKKMFAAIDCTGHGVPGAFMSLVGYTVLNQVTKVFTRPASILNNLNRLASEALRTEKESSSEIKDGMDVAFCTLDTESLELEFSGAYNSAYVIRNRELIELKGDKFSIGSFHFGDKEFSNQKYQLQPGDWIYTFTDGYADQFGGPEGRKFMKTKFRETLITASTLSAEKQRLFISQTLSDWMGSLDQVDDILVIGVRV
jgi:serine phosphatase RsbU (regulator of sigma subunit)/HAMP domain-containing protein